MSGGGWMVIAEDEHVAVAVIARTLSDGEDPGVNERMMARLIVLQLLRLGLLLPVEAVEQAIGDDS